MDWSLVLASQGIECSILHDEVGWKLQVPSDQRERALAAIAQYRMENRRWTWRERLGSSGAEFHWGVVGWCLVLAWMHAWTAGRGHAWRVAGQLDSVAVRGGEWWRLATAVSLHADLTHLMSNLTAGFIALGLAMSRWGAGGAVLMAGLAGVAGNVCSLLLHAGPHVGLGASGMVMGGLGLLTAPHRFARSGQLRPSRERIRGLLGGVLLFVLLGLNPASDVVAHAGGFVAGLALGSAVSAVAPGVGQRPAVSATGGSLALLAWAWCWWLAVA